MSDFMYQFNGRKEFINKADGESFEDFAKRVSEEVYKSIKNSVIMKPTKSKYEQFVDYYSKNFQDFETFCERYDFYSDPLGLVEEYYKEIYECIIENNKVEGYSSYVDGAALNLISKGYMLEEFAKEDQYRAAVVMHGYNVEQYANDPIWAVRAAVARHRVCLDKLVDDPNEWVRYAVADVGYGLDKLVKDPSKYVRSHVAEKGYGLEILVNDEDSSVRNSAANMLKKLYTDESNWKEAL